MMLKDITYVKPLEDHYLSLRFEDGTTGRVDVAALIKFTGVFGPLRDPEYFRQVRVNPEPGTICWPSGADLDPDVLYAAITGQPIAFSTPEVPLASVANTYV